MTIQELARQYVDMFEVRTRDNGEEFYCLKDIHRGSPLHELIREAHGDMMPDDYKYQFIYEAFLAVSENENIDDINLEADVYNHDLLKWLSSHLIRVAYCDEVIDNYPDKLDFMSIVQYAQHTEKNDILQNYVRFFLENQLELLEGEYGEMIGNA